MSPLSLHPSITSTTVGAKERRMHTLTRAGSSATVVLVHGNVSSGRFFEQTLVSLPEPYRGVAPDLRGFGDTDARPVDATRGMRDFADDLHALLQALEPPSTGQGVHLVGWSVGAGVVMQYAIDHPTEVASVVLVAPISPYGFGGTRDAEGTPCFDDHAGSGGGTANPEFAQRLRDGDEGEDSDMSPRKVLVQCYFKPPFRPDRAREDVLVREILKMAIADDSYPGDMTTSENWPTVAPGTRGMNNAISPRYFNMEAFVDIDPKPPVLWIRGADDVIVSDTSLFDFGYLGQLGLVPGWPGAEVFPPQPMIAQTRSLLHRYAENGGTYQEVVIDNTGHSPHIEAPEQFMSHLTGFLAANPVGSKDSGA